MNITEKDVGRKVITRCGEEGVITYFESPINATLVEVFFEDINIHRAYTRNGLLVPNGGGHPKDLAGWADDEQNETAEDKKMKYEPFDLERALAGEPVILRGGQKAYVRHYEKTLILRGDGRPLLGYRIYDGLAVEASWGSDGLWLRGREFPKDIVGMYPQHRLVNGVKVPVFPDWEPALGETVFVVDVTHAQFFYEQEWIGDELDLMYLDRGLVYPAITKGERAAELHSKAMLGIAEDNDE